MGRARQERLAAKDSAAQPNSAVKECHLLIEGSDINGRVTSISYSPAVEKTIGLAYVENPAAAVGDQIQIRTDSGSLVNAELVALPFYDPKGLRQSADIGASVSAQASP